MAITFLWTCDSFSPAQDDVQEHGQHNGKKNGGGERNIDLEVPALDANVPGRRPSGRPNLAARKSPAPSRNIAAPPIMRVRPMDSMFIGFPGWKVAKLAG